MVGLETPGEGTQVSRSLTTGRDLPFETGSLK